MLKIHVKQKTSELCHYIMHPQAMEGAKTVSCCNSMEEKNKNVKEIL